MVKEIPGPPSPEQMEEGRKLFAGDCAFFFGAQKLEQLFEGNRPELAFAGRSNVGKSSLINALTGRKALARASSEPGRTKQLNFFNLADRLTLVDMPGYGFAKASKSVKEDWQGMMFDYLRGRPNLVRVVLLIDSRVGLKASDREICDLLDKAAVVYQVVLTKCDAIKENELKKRLEEIQSFLKTHPAAFPFILPTSSEKSLGIAELRGILSQFSEPV
ncbi:YihA family ribosome biogenesis GTP-binding protein [Aristophania vespae]|uniref:Probable GTP-binding protein EngB n=1 Tax=Aristophania vespae TaxID=2697033 RepID=A0A6P1NER5_9PROT|nr:ribosome biogenesis GTP-binding protein YihA/YsxC [Aristophania vespae]QHI95347.1 YihA family ribosome biogenesis GTP-binding protein [Aristophania vespae]UMM64615.1 GTP-binding protein EngB [Aristophania vespae]